MAVSADQTLMGDAAPSSKLSMLKLDEASGGAAAKPKIVEVGEDGAFDMEAAAAAAEPEPEAEEEEASLMDLMMADASTDRTARAAKRTEEDKRMKKSFGDGMKKGLKKGFFDKKPAKPKPKKEEMPTITRSTKKEPGEVMQSMKEEIASSMAQDRHPLAAALSGGEWVTPDLIKEMAKRPVLAKGMSNPRYQAALQELQKDPKNGAKKFDSDPELKRFLTEFCEVMGSHMIKLAGDEDAPKPSTPALPTEKEKKEMGPLCSRIAEDCAHGKGPEPCKTHSRHTFFYSNILYYRPASTYWALSCPTKQFVLRAPMNKIYKK